MNYMRLKCFLLSATYGDWVRNHLRKFSSTLVSKLTGAYTSNRSDSEVPYSIYPVSQVEVAHLAFRNFLARIGGSLELPPSSTSESRGFFSCQRE